MTFYLQKKNGKALLFDPSEGNGEEDTILYLRKGSVQPTTWQPEGIQLQEKNITRIPTLSRKEVKKYIRDGIEIGLNLLNLNGEEHGGYASAKYRNVKDLIWMGW